MHAEASLAKATAVDPMQEVQGLILAVMAERYTGKASRCVLMPFVQVLAGQGGHAFVLSVRQAGKELILKQGQRKKENPPDSFQLPHQHLCHLACLLLYVQVEGVPRVHPVRHDAHAHVLECEWYGPFLPS